MTPMIKPRTAEVIIYQGDDLAQLAELRQAADVAARQAGPGRIGDDTAAHTAARAYDDFVTQAAERAVTVGLSQLPRRQWRRIRDTHPPREGNEDDRGAGFDVDAIGEELIPASITAPAFAGEADRETFLDSLAEADWERLLWTAVSLNAQPVADPKGMSLASALDQMSDETSKSPERLA